MTDAQAFVVYLLRAVSDLPERLSADKTESGKIIAAAIYEWLRSQNAGRSVCVCCDVEIVKGNLGGWVIMLPQADVPGAVASTGVFCGECARLDAGVLQDKILQSIGEEYDAEVTLHALQ